MNKFSHLRTFKLCLVASAALPGFPSQVLILLNPEGWTPDLLARSANDARVSDCSAVPPKLLLPSPWQLEEKEGRGHSWGAAKDCWAEEVAEGGRVSLWGPPPNLLLNLLPAPNPPLWPPARPSGSGRQAQWEVQKARRGRGGGEARSSKRPPRRPAAAPARPSSRSHAPRAGRGGERGSRAEGASGKEGMRVGESRRRRLARREHGVQPNSREPPSWWRGRAPRARSRVAAAASPCPSRPSCGAKPGEGRTGVRGSCPGWGRSRGSPGGPRDGHCSCFPGRTTACPQAPLFLPLWGLETH